MTIDNPDYVGHGTIDFDDTLLSFGIMYDDGSYPKGSVPRTRVSIYGIGGADLTDKQAEQVYFMLGRYLADRQAKSAAERELDEVNRVLREFGIEYPLGARGVRDLAGFARCDLRGNDDE